MHLKTSKQNSIHQNITIRKKNKREMFLKKKVILVKKSS